MLDQFYYQIILPKDYTKTEKLEEESIDLAFWNPPANWETEIFDKNISRKGTLSSIGNFETFPETNQALKEKVELFVKNSIKILGCKEKFPAIRSLVVLACLKNENPLPSVLWRTTIFSKFYKD